MYIYLKLIFSWLTTACLCGLLLGISACQQAEELPPVVATPILSFAVDDRTTAGLIAPAIWYVDDVLVTQNPGASPNFVLFQPSLGTFKLDSAHLSKAFIAGSRGLYHSDYTGFGDGELVIKEWNTDAETYAGTFAFIGRRQRTELDQTHSYVNVSQGRFEHLSIIRSAERYSDGWVTGRIGEERFATLEVAATAEDGLRISAATLFYEKQLSIYVPEDLLQMAEMPVGADSEVAGTASLNIQLLRSDSGQYNYFMNEVRPGGLLKLERLPRQDKFKLTVQATVVDDRTGEELEVDLTMEVFAG